jgi:hypothetical protein
MLDDISLGRIQQRKIREYIEHQVEEGKHNFSEIHSSWNRGVDLSVYRKKELTYFLNGRLQDIWQGYLSANPSKSWNDRRISFGLLLQKFPINIFYNQDSIAGIDTGQIYFLNLKLMQGICNIPVAFEIITINPEEKIIEFSYLEGNKSQGVQQIKFIDSDDERIMIIHRSYFKSDSHFRDKLIYPFFHKKIVNGFHRNMRRLLNLDKQ